VPSLVPGFEYDVFLSYARDDIREWTIAFKEQLEAELRQALGAQKERRLWIDKDLRTGEVWPESIAEGVRRSASLLALLSPNYFASLYCREEAELFEKSRTAGLSAGDLFKVVRAPDLDKEYESFQGRFQNAIFFSRDTEASLVPGTPEFTTQLHTLVKHIKFALVEKRNACRKVFIAPPPLACAASWQNFRAELARQRFHVLAPLHAKAEDGSSTAALEQCTHSIHLLGSEWDQRTADFLCRSAEMEKTLLIYLATDLETQGKQRELVDALRRHEVPGASAAHPRIIELSAGERDAIGEVVNFLGRPPATTGGSDGAAGGEVYLMCDVDGADLEAGRAVAKAIEAQTGKAVSMPALGQNPEDRAEQHRSLMKEADALVAFSEHSPARWLDQKVRDIRYPARFARTKPVRASAVVLGNLERAAGLDLADIPLLQASRPLERTSFTVLSQALRAS
jgi:hypothetical protein